MIPDTVKAKILIAIAQGQSVGDAAQAYGFKYAQARGAFPNFCRRLGLRWDLDEIKTHPQKYIDAALKVISMPQNSLRRPLRVNLIKQLRLTSAEELTPRYVSCLTAEMLLSNGVTENAITEIQKWLLAHNYSIKRKVPNSDEHLRIAEKALHVLDAFGFDMSVAKNQLKTLGCDVG